MNESGREASGDMAQVKTGVAGVVGEYRHPRSDAEHRAQHEQMLRAIYEAARAAGEVAAKRDGDALLAYLKRR